MTLAVKVRADLFRIAYTCVSTEETRYYLNGVYVEPLQEGGALLVSTDGHRLVCIHDRDGTATEGVIVKLSKELLGLCKTTKDGVRTLSISGSDATIGTDVTPIAFAPKCLIDGEFPEWRKVVPKIEGPGAVAPAFNSTYLDGFARIGIALGKAFNVSAFMRVVAAEEGAPAIIRWGGVPDAFGILMPVRVDEMSPLPPFYAVAGSHVADTATAASTSIAEAA